MSRTRCLAGVLMMSPASSGGSVDGTIKITECTKSGSCNSRVATRKDGVVRSVLCALRDVAKLAIRAATARELRCVDSVRFSMPYYVATVARSHAIGVETGLTG